MIDCRVLDLLRISLLRHSDSLFEPWLVHVDFEALLLPLRFFNELLIELLLCSFHLAISLESREAQALGGKFGHEASCMGTLRSRILFDWSSNFRSLASSLDTFDLLKI